MTGPENYRESERLIVEAATYDPRDAAVMLVAAQARATLALAAATVAPFVAASDTTVDGPAADWQAVTS